MSPTPAQSPLTVTRGDRGDCVVLYVEGRVDHTNSDGFLEALTAETGVADGSKGLVIDLGELEFITSAGLRGLTMAQAAMSKSGAKMAICGLKGTVAEVFRISRFDKLFPIAEDVKAASALVSA
ncbi:MAG: STAS domain-containing protein [Pseudomonadota bacterium]